ncbi:MAG: thiol reductant ABC exporter subunit CydD, partial [Gluconacetobacter diazotrophicus]|nr:thiol reductant ABC exporter subunit CydD [Gluconacetobacter diazotrophicus]
MEPPARPAAAEPRPPAAAVPPADRPRSARTAARTWSREQGRIGRRRAWPVVLLGATSTVLAIAQNWCVAVVLAHALARLLLGAAGTVSPLPLAGFAVLALCRAGLGIVQEDRAAALGTAARRRLRGGALRAVLADGPALLRRSDSGTLAALLIDRIEALDGFFCRWIPAAVLAVVAPALVLLVVCAVQPRAALVLLCCGLAVPVAQAVFGIGAGLASRRQFVAMARLQGRFLDRVRGIATLVVSGQADAEALRLHEAADELRRRTMRVLRVAFLSSAALDCAFAVALVLIALLDGRSLLAGGAARSWLGALLLPRSLFALLLVPEFFAPLRAFALAYQDRMQVAGAAEALLELPGTPADPPPAAGAVRTVLPAAAMHPGDPRGTAVSFESVSFTWDPARGRILRDVSFAVA